MCEKNNFEFEFSQDRNRVKEVSKGWLYGLKTLVTLGLSGNKVFQTFLVIFFSNFMFF